MYQIDRIVSRNIQPRLKELKLQLIQSSWTSPPGLRVLQINWKLGLFFATDLP